MKQSSFLILFIVLILIINRYDIQAQSFGSNVIGMEKVKQDSSNISNHEKTALFQPKVRLNLGTSFTSFGNQFNGFSTWVAPEVGMPVSKKVEVSFGMAYTSMHFNTSIDYPVQSQTNNYGSMYVSGTYHVNNKLSVRATGYKTFLLNPENFNNENQNSYLDFSNQGAILDLEYKITDNFRINASFQYHEQNNPNYFYTNPYGGNGGFNSFSNPTKSSFGTFNSFGPGF